MRVLGVDVSHWEGRVDWLVAYPTMGFAYYKATDYNLVNGRFFTDDQFINNRDGCNMYGLPHAPYHYLEHGIDPKAQADYFLSVVTPGSNYKRYILDVEAAGITATEVKAFLDRVQSQTGIKPAIYTSAGYWNRYGLVSWAYQYDLIVAHYTAAHSPTLPLGWSAYKIWQFSDHFFFPGCETAADGNWFEGDIQACRDWFGNYRLVDKPLQPSPVAPTGAVRLQVICDGLNVRAAPAVGSLGAKIIGSLKRGDVVEAQDFGGSSCWVQIKSGPLAGGWCAVSYGSSKYMQIEEVK